MLRDKNLNLRLLVTVLLVGSLFGMVLVSSVHAAPGKNPAQAGSIVDTPTNTPVTPTVTLTPTQTNTPTVTNTPAAPGHIVISEFRTNGPYGAYDEFVELYNPTGAAVNIGGWQIITSSGCGSFTSLLATFDYGTILLPGQHYLLAATGSNTSGPYSSISNEDQIFTPGIDDKGGLALANSSGTVDAVGMCSTTY